MNFLRTSVSKSKKSFFLITYLNFADLEGKFLLNSIEDGTFGFFSIILNNFSGWTVKGWYRDILLFSDKLEKKYLTILSSNEWNVTTAKTPSFLKTFDAEINP